MRAYARLGSPPSPSGGGNEGGGGVQFVPYLFHHYINVIQNFVIPESQNPESRSLQIPGAHCVRFNAISMLPTIDFDNEHLLKTYEVKNGRIKRVLATKLDSQLIAA